MSEDVVAHEEMKTLRSQIVTLQSKSYFRYPPKAFTEHGAIMAANVLNSPQAVEMGVSEKGGKDEGNEGS